MSRAFTMIEMLLAVLLVGVLTTLSVLTFSAVSHGWQSATDYMDKMQRTDYALNQVISGLKSMYYPHDGKQDDRYGFVLINNGDGDSPDNSDIIEWSKTGTAIVGNGSAVADTVHRVQVMMLEEGNTDYYDADGHRIQIELTGLYARLCPDAALRPTGGDNKDDEDYSFQNANMYEPVLISDGVVGFNCRVVKTADQVEGKDDEDKFEDEFSDSGDAGQVKSKGVGGDESDTPKNKTVPYKLELTFYIKDPDGKSYRTNVAPMMRIITIPIHEQSLDGNSTPDSQDSKNKRTTPGGGGTSGGKGGTTTGGKGGGNAPGGSGRGGGGGPGGGGGGGGVPPPGGPM